MSMWATVGNVYILLEHFYFTLVMIIWKHVTLGGEWGREAPYAPTVPLNWCVTTIKISRRKQKTSVFNVNCACAY